MTYEDLHRDFGGMIRRIAASYAPPGAAREDLEQEIAVALMGALGKFRGGASLKTYVSRIANNCGIDYLRSRERSFYDVDDLELTSRSASPEDSVVEAQRRERLAAGIRQLPLNLRQPMVLRLEGFSYDEIADSLGLSSSNVGVRLHRATAMLKELIHE